MLLIAIAIFLLCLLEQYHHSMQTFVTFIFLVLWVTQGANVLKLTKVV